MISATRRSGKRNELIWIFRPIDFAKWVTSQAEGLLVKQQSDNISMTDLVINYSILDVFTRTRFCGNPVAVIHDGSHLTTSQMHAIAREFGFSETTFVLPPKDAASTAQVRIFTPFEEVPFAGHPNIGTAFVIATEETAASSPLPDDLILDELGGMVSVQVLRDGRIVVGAEIEAPQVLQTLGEVDPELMAKCLGLTVTDMKVRTFVPCVASIGLPFAFVELEDLTVLSKVTPDIASFREAAKLGPSTVDGFAICAFVVMRKNGDDIELRTRVFSPLGHPMEDPATGSASGALAQLISDATDLSIATYKITQGVEMGRESNILVRTVGIDRSPLIEGACVMVSKGTMWV